jgi:hypothetical protein
MADALDGIGERLARIEEGLARVERMLAAPPVVDLGTVTNAGQIKPGAAYIGAAARKAGQLDAFHLGVSVEEADRLMRRHGVEVMRSPQPDVVQPTIASGGIDHDDAVALRRMADRQAGEERQRKVVEATKRIRAALGLGDRGESANSEERRPWWLRPW